MELTDTHTVLGRYAEDLAKAQIQISDMVRVIKERDDRIAELESKAAALENPAKQGCS